MYAITAISYRAIASAEELQTGETASDTVPDSLLATLQGIEVRAQRDAMLATCDWTQANDSPLDAATRAAWATYRTALRNVPAQPGFPASVTWPISP